ncbi:MAG: DUF1611 domain-containing protein [Chloroflexota bacterium]
MPLTTRRIVILAEATLDFHHGKTAVSLLRYRADEVVAVIDSKHAGCTAEQVLGCGDGIPICQNFETTLQYRPTELVIGIAPKGGTLPLQWRTQILQAIRHGVDIVSGLHYMMNDDPEFFEAATKHRVRLVDVRRPPDDLSVAEFAPRRTGSHVVTFVGSDCAVGKMTAALEISSEMRRRGHSSAFVATGQTGIMLEGSGIAIDRVIGDFMSGSVEQLVVSACEEADWVFVEGQGSLLHPGYSGVTLALLHGSTPDAMILVHPPGHDFIDDYPVRIPSLDRLVSLYEDAAGWVKPARVVGIALNTRALGDAETVRAMENAREITGLPVIDPIRFGADILVDAVLGSLAAPMSSSL